MEIVIGVQLSSRELKVEVADGETDKLRKQVEKVFADAAGGSNPVLWIVDKDGRTIGVPSDKLAYVEIGSDMSSRRVGFSRG